MTISREQGPGFSLTVSQDQLPGISLRQFADRQVNFAPSEIPDILKMLKRDQRNLVAAMRSNPEGTRTILRTHIEPLTQGYGRPPTRVELAAQFVIDDIGNSIENLARLEHKEAMEELEKDANTPDEAFEKADKMYIIRHDVAIGLMDAAAAPIAAEELLMGRLVEKTHDSLQKHNVSLTPAQEAHVYMIEQQEAERFLELMRKDKSGISAVREATMILETGRGLPENMLHRREFLAAGAQMALEAYPVAYQLSKGLKGVAA